MTGSAPANGSVILMNVQVHHRKKCLWMSNQTLSKAKTKTQRSQTAALNRLPTTTTKVKAFGLISRNEFYGSKSTMSSKSSLM